MNTDDRHEARLLLAILGERWDLASSLRARPATQPARIMRLARDCDALPWLHAVLERAGREDLLGPAEWEELTRVRHRCRMENALLLARAEEVLDALLAAGIVPIAVKGLDFVHRFYSGFDARTMDDFDLLVPPSAVPAAIEAMRGIGWKTPDEPMRLHWMRSMHELPMTSPGPLELFMDLHWGLAQAERYRLAIGPVIERARPLEINGRHVLRLDDHDAAGHLLIHHLQHYFDRRVKWMLEFHWLTRQPGFSWATLAERLGEWGACGAAGVSLLHLRKLFPHHAPAESGRLLPAAAWRLALTLPLRSSHPLDLFRGTRRRTVQLWLAAALLEHPAELPRYLLHRARRDRESGAIEAIANDAADAGRG